VSLGAWTLSALGAVVVVSCFTRLNPGVLSIVMAWIIGVYGARMPLREVAGGFPVELFLTLTGVSLLFSLAAVNGTLDALAQNASRLCRGRVGLVPVMFFVIGAALASIGPGNIATAGLLAPVAMATAARMRISPFLMALMAGSGANAGALSPLAPTGIIANGLMAKIGLTGLERETWFYNLAGHAVLAFAGYALFGGWRLLGRMEEGESTAAPVEITRTHWLTMAIIGALIGGVLIGKWNIGMAAFGAAVVMSVLRLAKEDEAIRRIPWSTILMVCGVTVLVALLEKSSGTALFAEFITSVSTRETAVPVLGALTGAVSAYASTSGVVLPAFLPMVPDLANRLHANPASLAQTINVAGHLVDVSPLSTIGALCVAAIPSGDISRKLFNQLLAWGLSMTVAGALWCWLLWR
jgi:di/tricarboxylate transporter